MKPIRDNPSIQPFPGMIKLVRRFRGAYGLIRALGIKCEKLTAIAEAADEVLKYAAIVDLPDRFNTTFVGRGWICTDSLSVPVMQHALSLANEGRFNEADQHIANFFDEENLRRCTVWRARRFHKVAAREDQIEQAIRLYLDGLYWGALPLILIAADGLGSDVTGLSIFKEGEDLTLFDSIVGHPSGLHALVKEITRTRKKTTDEAINLPFRNGILHGRDLGYADRVTCAKGWMLLVALVDWAVSRDEEARRRNNHEKRTDMTFRDIAEGVRKNEEVRRALDAWTPRTLSSPLPSKFEEDTPEAALEAFLAFWKAENYGGMGRLAVNLTGKSDSKMAGEMRTDAKPARLIDYELLFVEQATLVAASARARLRVCGFDQELEVVFNLGAMRVGRDGGVPLPNEFGRWQVRQSVIWDVRKRLQMIDS